MQDVLSRFGTVFIVSAFVPSLGFTLMAMFIFEPLIPSRLATRFPVTFETPTTSVLLLFVITVILGYTLNNLSTFLFKIVEGYYLLIRFPVLRRRQQAKAKYWFHRLENINKLLTHLETIDPDSKNTRAVKLKKRLQDEEYTALTFCDLNYPPTLNAVLPTRFGNILRASESYAPTRYGIDSVPMWPRLIHAIPENYHRHIDQSYQGMGFLINCLILALLMGGLCLLAAIYQFYSWRLSIAGVEEILYFLPIDDSSRMQMIYLQRGWLYFILTLLCLGVALFFYHASIPIAAQFGNMIRSAYDLFRFQLLKSLHREIPNNYQAEYDLWKNISRFVNVGDVTGSLQFFYQTGEGTDEAEILLDLDEDLTEEEE